MPPGSERQRIADGRGGSMASACRFARTVRPRETASGRRHIEIYPQADSPPPRMISVPSGHCMPRLESRDADASGSMSYALASRLRPTRRVDDRVSVRPRRLDGGGEESARVVGAQGTHPVPTPKARDFLNLAPSSARTPSRAGLPARVRPNVSANAPTRALQKQLPRGVPGSRRRLRVDADRPGRGEPFVPDDLSRACPDRTSRVSTAC